VIFDGVFFVMSFKKFLDMHTFFSLLLWFALFKSVTLHMMFISLCKKKRLNNLVNQKRKDILFFSMFFWGGFKN
jgi:hypothetical protein